MSLLVFLSILGFALAGEQYVPVNAPFPHIVQALNPLPVRSVPYYTVEAPVTRVAYDTAQPSQVVVASAPSVVRSDTPVFLASQTPTYLRAPATAVPVTQAAAPAYVLPAQVVSATAQPAPPVGASVFYSQWQ